MKKVLSALLVFAMVIACFAFTTSAAFSGNLPTEKWYTKKDAVIEVATAEQLVFVFNDMSKNGNQFERKTIKLTADITINEGDFNKWAENAPKYNWMDYATGGTFVGTFDGNGHTISGIYANGFYDGKDYMSYEDYKTNGQGGLHYTGLFFKLGGTVKNLRITNSYFCGPYGTAAIAGSLSAAATFENVQIDTTKVFGTYAQTSDPALPDIADQPGPYEKHSATGAFVGLCAVTSITMKNCVFQGTVVGGGRFVGGLLGNLNKTHVEMNSCGFIGVYESFYSKYYNGVNLFKENSGGLLGRTDDTAETGTVMNDCFFIGSFKANAQSTTSGALIARCTKFTADNCWVNDDAYDKFYDPSKTENLKGGDTGMNWEKLSKLTGKDSVANIGLDDKVWTSVEGIGPMLTAFQSAAAEITTAAKTTVGNAAPIISQTPIQSAAPTSSKVTEAPATSAADKSEAPASSAADKSDAPAATSAADKSEAPAATSAADNTTKPTAKPTKKPAANTGDVTVYMIAAVVISAAAAVVISKSRTHA